MASSKASRAERSLAVLPELSAAETLEPIANTSKFVPDLAESEAISTVPDLADPVVPIPAQDSAEKAGNSAIKLSLQPETLSFHGVTPGDSNRRDVLREWGDPRSEETTAKTLLYRFDKLRSVRVKFDGIMVDTIVVELEQPLTTGKLIRKLALEGIRPALLSDAAGTPLAQAYPERGVVLRFEGEDHADNLDDADFLEDRPTTPRPKVTEIVIQPIKAAGFLLRAENYRSNDISQCLSDLQQALELDRSSAHAYWLLSDVYLALGQGVKAEGYAVQAVDLEPLNHIYRLQYARCLRRLSRYDSSIKQVQTVLESTNSQPLVRAQALYEMGMLSSSGLGSAAERAVTLYTKAIEIADRLATSDDAKVSQQAKNLLVEAHLSMAVEIARGEWERKEQTVPQWIERASAISEEMIVEDHTNLPLRLHVAVSALAAAASLENPIDPELWIEEAEETANLLQVSIKDRQTLDQYNWNLGLVYFHGLQIEHSRSEPDKAEYLGKQAVAKLRYLSKSRDQLPDTAYLMGRLYFQIGAIFAVHHDDHITACRWYDQAAHYLLNTAPVTTIEAPRQHGDALVSMGVSYWHTNRRKGAIEVTQSGVDLIERAVESGRLNTDALVVPYGNLAAMYEAEGDTEPAEKYSRLAKQAVRTKVSSAPSTQQLR